jgi:signal transduction histidine kinase
MQIDNRDCVVSFHRQTHDKGKQAKLNSWNGSWNWNVRTDATYWSEQLYWIIGREDATIPSFTEHSCFYTSESWIRLVDATLALLKTGTPYELRLQMRHTDGTRRWVIHKGEAVRDERGDIVELCGTVQDIGGGMAQVNGAERNWHTRSNAEDAICRLIQAQEDQNGELASKLRNHVCQRVSLLAVGIQSLNSTLPDLSPQAQAQLDSFWQETKGILAELARISDRLYPIVVDLLGLSFAMRRLCRDFTTQHGIPVGYSCSDLPENCLDRECKLVLYRVLEDILANVARHSRANNVTVSLDHDSAEFRLRVSDNGVGFDQVQVKTAAGLGFVRIRTQIGRVGGSMAVWSQHALGTLIEVSTPITVPSYAVPSRQDLPGSA